MHIIGSAIHSWSQIYNLFPDHTCGFRENDVFLRQVSKFRMLADMFKAGGNVTQTLSISYIN